MKWNWRDAVAGLSVAGLLLPEAIAYSSIAGLTPRHAVTATIAGCTAYFFIGRCRFAVVSPTSSSAAILAAMLMSMDVPASQKALFAAVVVALAGLVFLIASAMGLGYLAGVISRPVLRGFAFGTALLITIKQLPTIFGLSNADVQPWEILRSALARFHEWNLISLGLALFAFVCLLAIRRYREIPGSLFVTLGAAAISFQFNLEGLGVPVVGPVSLAIGWDAFAAPDLHSVEHIARYTLPLVLIVFAESWGTVRSLSLLHGEVVDANRELRAIGVANIVSALVQGMPVGAGFSAGSASEAAGSQSKLSSLLAAAFLAAFCLFGVKLLAYIPQTVLAAVIVSVLLHSLDPSPVMHILRVGRDRFLLIFAACGVLLFGVLNGMLIAVALSFVLFLKRLTVARVITLGRLRQTRDFVDVERHADATEIAGISIFRPAQPLFFANAELVLSQIATHALSNRSTLSVIVSLEESVDLDSTGFDALLEFDTLLHKAGKRVYYARVHDWIRDLMESAGEAELASRCNFSVDDAVTQAVADAANPTE